MGSFGLVSLPGTLSYCLPKKTGTEDFRPLQDLCAVNSAIVTLHPVVPNVHMLLGLIPAEAKFFTCLDLRNTFFCICLAPQNQPMFAFQWESSSTGEKGQLTWTPLPQGFKKLSHCLWDCPGVQPKDFLGPPAWLNTPPVCR
jgi:hypothetical protein